MKKIQLLTIMVLTGAVAFSAQATAHKAKVNFQESLARVESSGSIADLVIDSKEAIHGLQFDIKYNPEEIKSITPQDISGFEVKYNELSEGVIRGLIFSLQGLQLTENLTFEFENVEGFNGNSTIEFTDIILAGSKGNNVDAEAQSYEISFSDRVAKNGMSGAYPNPFNPTTEIKYELKNSGHVEVMIYDATGRLVEELVNSYQESGISHSVSWNAANQASGMYFAKMATGDFVQTQKLVLLK
tara:strand:- start:1773 stop:2501 length:729 start_codon:yes stop_codon:yes gene_type:complete